MIPECSSSFNRAERMLVGIRGRPWRKSVNRLGPTSRSRTIRSAQRSPTSSSALTSPQNCPYSRFVMEQKSSCDCLDKQDLFIASCLREVKPPEPRIVFVTFSTSAVNGALRVGVAKQLWGTEFDLFLDGITNGIYHSPMKQV